MAKVFNPWTDPPKLTGDLASFELNDTDTDAADAKAPASHEAAMSQALQVISQQAALIAKLMASMGTGTSSGSASHE